MIICNNILYRSNMYKKNLKLATEMLANENTKEKWQTKHSTKPNNNDNSA